MNIFYVLLVAISIASVFTFFLWYFILKPTGKFYEDASILDKDIRENNDQLGQISKLIKLNNKSWHRITHEEIKRFGSMIEVKYNIKIFK